MIISLIAALTSDNIIGINNTIPWHLSKDLIWFKKHTYNKPVIMGRKTFDSIKKPLYGRRNIVLSRKVITKPTIISSVHWVNNSIQALAAAGNVSEVMVIGGAQVYNIFINQAKKLYLTHINIKVDGDTFFPNYQHDPWRVTFRECHEANININSPSYCFEILER
ncbi:type 3 dihydrofolate reductase [Candidatus Palibaumannia cicadellinicola]|uniref:Dihydrofolate reductase n=1 Tax=Candidatus Palibaumannia cicadellinicola TaxID=186490 RepID=A0A0K2BL96_9GAMM|nr:type 3 dihydrofolate reductase [Candidatus Baumannia cicadellinicola]AKZ66090.1 Dihydrofolate reductase [Candidatus Baumannia cicadellinicola]